MDEHDHRWRVGGTACLYRAWECWLDEQGGIGGSYFQNDIDFCIRDFITTQPFYLHGMPGWTFAEWGDEKLGVFKALLKARLERFIRIS